MRDPRRIPRLAAGALVALTVLGAPLLLSDLKLAILVSVIAAAIAALGLDVLVGRTGQLSLGHAALLGVGAYTAINTAGAGAPWPATFVVASAVTALAATITGLPSLRIRGLQIAIVTLAFQQGATEFLFTNQTFVGLGKSFTRPGILRTDTRLYVFAVALLALVLVVRRRLGLTRAGRAFQAIRDVEGRTPSFGIEPGPTKLLAYAISGAIVGLGGALFALRAESIATPESFVLLESLLLVAIVVVGGAGSGAGIILATLLLKGLPLLVSISFIQRYTPLLSAALLIVAIVGQPTGIGGVLRQLDETLGDLFGGRRERPSPRPRFVDVTDVAEQATELRRVPRAMNLRVPVRALLEATDVTVRYGGVRALDGLNLEVRRGEIVGLIGANGAGKSTFFNAASGYAPTTGSIRYRGIELLDRPPSKRTTFGVARTFQDMGLVRSETVRENVLLAQTWLARYSQAGGILALGATVATERELRRRADMALELFGLDHLAEERLGDLPYGTMRIAEIAAAVATGPDVLLLDEATAGLGPEESQSLGDRFLTLREELGLTLVVIEHHVPLIARVCDYCYCLESGRLIAEGEPEFVVSQPQVVVSFLGRAAAAQGTGQ